MTNAFAALRAAHIRDESISPYGDTLIAYHGYHGEDCETDLATLRADSASRNTAAEHASQRRVHRASHLTARRCPTS